MNATCIARITTAFAVAVKFATACVALAISACAITEIRDSDNRSSWSFNVLSSASTPVKTSRLTYVRSRALGWQQTGSEHTFGLIWREAVIARDAEACTLVVLLDAPRADDLKLNEQTRFFSTLGNCHVVPLSKG